MTMMLAAGALVASCFHLSCTGEGDRTKYTGAPSDVPGTMDNPGPQAGGDSRGTRSAAEMDSINAATKDTSTR